MDEATERRFWAKVNKDGPVHPTLGTKCWLWTGCLGGNGYGYVRIKNVSYVSHRVSYEMAGGVIPAGLEIDHLCRVRCCVNPRHLEPVTGRENQIRSPFTLASIFSAKTHCPKGHAYAGDNLRIAVGGGRICRACHSARETARNARNRALRRASQASLLAEPSRLD